MRGLIPVTIEETVDACRKPNLLLNSMTIPTVCLHKYALRKITNSAMLKSSIDRWKERNEAIK